MQNSTSTKQKDILNMSSSTESTPNSESSHLVKREHIEGTPFWMIEKDGKAFATMGKYRITEPMESKELVKAWMDEHTWELVLTVIGIVLEEAGVLPLRTKEVLKKSGL